MAFGERQLAILAMLGAMTIYGTNFAISRFGILNGLTPNDMTALRFTFAGVALLPLFIKAGVRSCAGIGWGKGLVVTLMSGLPITLLMMQGLAFSPAAHGSAIGPGTVTVIGAIGGYFLFGIRPTRLTIIGIAIVLAGLTLIGVAVSASGARNVLLGDLCFLGVGLIWGGYPLVLQYWKLDALKATTALSVISMLLFMPYYLATSASHLLTVPFGTLIFHGINQGLLNVVLGLWLWGWAVAKLGVSIAGRFPPLIPVIGAFSAIPLLGEWPGALQWTGIGLIVAGLLITTLKRAQ